MHDTPKTTTVRLHPRDRRLIEAAARTRKVGPCTYLRIAALHLARRDLGVEPQPDENGS